LRPVHDLGIEKRLHGGPNSLAAEGVAAMAARIATAGKRIGSTFLFVKQYRLPFVRAAGLSLRILKDR
jgi:hypothetical protein